MYKLSEIIDAEFNKLISDLIEGSFTPPADTESTISQQQHYQLPVKHTAGGAPIDKENKPSILGHFLQDVNINPKHPTGHNGVDFQAPKNSPVYAIAPGIVIKTDIYPNTGGNTIHISHEDGKIVSYYAHLESVSVRSKQEIGAGTIIGRVGNTGNAYDTSPHLHLEVKIDGNYIDPSTIIGQLVGSVSKKAAFIKKLIEKLDEKYSKKKVLRKIAVEINLDIKPNEVENKIFNLLKQVIAEKSPDTILRVAV